MTTFKPDEAFWVRHAAIVISGGFVVLSASYILLSDRLLLAMGGTSEQITDLQTLKGIAFVTTTGILLFLIIRSAVKAIRRSARAEYEANERYRRMIETTNEGVWIIDKRGMTTFVNDTMADMLGTTPDHLIGQPQSNFVDAESSVPQLEQLRRHENGERDIYECALLRADGQRIWTIVSGSPLSNRNGQFDGVLRMVNDFTERKEAENALKESLALQRQLLNELDHRIRNNLASLISLVELTAVSARDVDAFASSIRGRIDAMNRAYSMLSSSKWKHQSLRMLLSSLLSGRHAGRVRMTGPEVSVAPSLVSAVSLVFHELLDNAVRFGSLSVSDGIVEVHWRVLETSDNGTTLIELEWRERAGLAPAEPVELNAGLDLLRGLIQSDLRGSVDFGFPAIGAHHTMRLKLGATAEQHALTQNKSLHRLNVDQNQPA